ncbi:MAG: Uncharacterised protein [Marine Group II euryarchaeote MED-G33]|nr:MAG: Uncharacterised protein [Marine Group II euryarchaeote MED-G33]
MSGGKKKHHSEPKNGLFDDLESLSDSEISERLESLKATATATGEQQRRVKQERDAEITLVQSLRDIQESNRGFSKERNGLLTEFRKIRDEANKVKSERDTVNENVPPPLEIIEQRLIETHRRLATIPHDLSKMPNRKHETKLFSFFFELKAMHSQKLIGNQLHQKYIELLRNQKNKLQQLDKLNDEKKSVAEEAREELPNQKANPKEIRKLNERIAKMLETINTHRSELKGIKREIGRLEAYTRVRKKGNKGNRGRRKIQPRLDEVKARANSGKSLSMEDFSALLGSGSLLDSLKEKTKTKSEQKSEPKKRRPRQSGAARGKRRTLSPEEKEKRRR